MVAFGPIRMNFVPLGTRRGGPEAHQHHTPKEIKTLGIHSSILRTIRGARALKLGAIRYEVTTEDHL